MLKLYQLLIAVAFLSGCATLQQDPTTAYNRAVDDAAVAESSEISDRLFAINSENQVLRWQDGKVLVVTWKSRKSFEENYEERAQTSLEEQYVTWVTAVPQVQAFCRDYVRQNPQGDLDLRLKQYLGLKPDWNYDVFIELWVDPADLFRPCVDPEIHDSRCELKFAENEVPQVRNIVNYPAFYKNLYFNDFRSRPGVPWTGLGYTYDWGHPHSRVGASEYILRPGSPYQIKRDVTTAEYCR
ncbi:MAG: hypothetical protein K2Y09_09055 [Nitrosomonas sp.]|uniref:hypothetical protein n=1 Tax=Nitrosomonas sp. TaxID=42353 RepID=UPI001DA26348|nr:hypothetical protein [Nitrosomonas sp.]MBX9895312.1 hypothetical protein [Nitrosomonas sp.]